jgi:hypothetical protein
MRYALYYSPPGNACRAGRVAQVVEGLPSKCEALSSSPSIIKKKEKKRNQKLNPF